MKTTRLFPGVRWLSVAVMIGFTLLVPISRTQAAPGDELFATVDDAYNLQLKKLKKLDETLSVKVYIITGSSTVKLTAATPAQVKYDKTLAASELKDFAITPRAPVEAVAGEGANLLIVIYNSAGTRVGGTVVAVNPTKIKRARDGDIKAPVRTPIGVGRR